MDKFSLLSFFENIKLINGHIHKMSMQGIFIRNGHIPQMNTYHTFPSTTIFITNLFENIILTRVGNNSGRVFFEHHRCMSLARYSVYYFVKSYKKVKKYRNF